MRLTKKDILAQRSRMTKAAYTIDLVSGCYVDKGKQKLLNFTKDFSDLKNDMLTQYLDIVKKVFCSAMESNMLELKFQKNSRGEARQSFLKKLVSDQLQSSELINQFYDSFIQSYKGNGNYLLLVFHDTYPETDSEDEESAIHAVDNDYLIFAVCPVDRSMHALACETKTNALELTDKNWIVGKPDLGFIYPPMISGRLHYDAVAYYVNTGKESHPEIMDQVLGCVNQLTALEEREKLQDIVSEAFDDVQLADNIFLQLQKELCTLALADEQEAAGEPSDDYEDSDHELPELTPQLLESCLDKIYMPDDSKMAIVRSYEREFGAAPPVTAKIADKYLIKRSLQQLKVLQLEDQVRKLTEELAQKNAEIEALHAKLDDDNNS